MISFLIEGIDIFLDLCPCILFISFPDLSVLLLFLPFIRNLEARYHSNKQTISINGHNEIPKPYLVEAE